MKRRTPEQWRALFTEHAASGMTMAVFCRERGINPNYFSLRRKQLGARNGVEGASVFAPVAITAPSAAMIEVQLNGEVRLRVPTTVSPHWLADLVQQLRS